MSRNMVCYIICMFYFLCEIVTISITNKLIAFSDVAIIISVYGIMFINYYIINKTIICFVALALKLYWLYNY